MVAESWSVRSSLRRGAVVGAAFLAVAGCSAAVPEHEPEPAAPVVHPGEPGAEPQVGRADDSHRPQRTLDVEADYVRGMIQHHAQALRMTGLAEDRVQHPRVRALADRIAAAQGPEIGAMRGWLDSHDLPRPEAGHGRHGDHGQHAHGANEPGQHDDGRGEHAAMPGMATEQQITDLAASSGTEFDRRFLQLMSAHHEGAVRMATDLLTSGRDEQVHTMAQDVLVTQRSEIGAMRELAAELA